MNSKRPLKLICAVLAVTLAACTPAATPTATGELLQPTASELPTSTPLPSATSTTTSTPRPFELSSAAFEDGGVIPDRFSCNGDDISPELSWGDPPPGTQSFALIFEDPGTGGGAWVHWVMYNLPASSRSLPEAVLPGETIVDGVVHGSSSWDTLDYGGPCPPQGSTHHYVFMLYALDTVLDLEAGASKRELQTAMEGHILAEVELGADFTR